MKASQEVFKETAQSLASFIQKSPSVFHAISSMKQILDAQGFCELQEDKAWNIEPGGKYYVIRNQSSMIALQPGDCQDQMNIQIAASHSDSPTFKVKEHKVLEVRRKYAHLNTEGYGGMLCAPWFDRPLSLAGRAIVKKDHRFTTKLVNFDRDLLMIPNVAIHMNRAVNEGMSYNKQIDLLPLIGGPDFTERDFQELLAKEIGVEASQIYGTDLYLYNRMAPAIWGAREEYISAPQLDDLQCAYASLMAFLQGNNKKNVNVFACMDNEEVGSATKQGAASTFLGEVLKRTFLCLGKTEEDYLRAVASGFLLSCDNAHAVHPNHPEKTDDNNCAYMNEGIVIKSHAGQKYTSDAVSIAAFKAICEAAEVPVQFFANRSDAAGGSTLGNIAMSHVSMNSVDIGLPQLAMHSPYETAGVRDTWYMIQAITEFYNHHLAMENDGFTIE